MALYEQGYGAHIHLEPVFLHDGAERLFVGRAFLGGREKGFDLREVPLEACGGDDLERPRRRITRVPEGVWHVAGLENQVSGPRDAGLVPDLYTNLALEHVGVLVLVLVGVHRCSEDARLHRMLDKRKGLPGLLPVDHEPHPKPAEPHRLSLIRRQHDARA